MFEPKRRRIAAAPYRDRVVHHALCNVLAPVLERRLIARSCSCQVGKGTMAARECCRRLTYRYRFVLKCDVSKFFPNIDHRILQEKLAEWVACPEVMKVIEQIIASFRTTDEAPVPLFAGDDLVEAVERPRGLPIGNLTSQLWGNFYLDALDHRLTETEGHGAYLRYTDDFLIFGDDKVRLWKLSEAVREELMRVRLKLAEPKSRLLATREGLPFCGFRFLPGLRPRVLGATKRRFEARRHAWHRRGADWATISGGVFAWYQFSREGNAEGLRRAYVLWPFDPRLRRRRRPTRSRVLRGGSFNNNESDNLLSSNRNNNDPDNRNDNNGFRCVVVVSAPKAERLCAMPGGHGLPDPSQEVTSLTGVPAPR